MSMMVIAYWNLQVCNYPTSSIPQDLTSDSTPTFLLLATSLPIKSASRSSLKLTLAGSQKSKHNCVTIEKSTFKPFDSQLTAFSACLTLKALTLFLRQILSQALQNSPQIRRADVPAVVFVEHAECVSKLAFLLLGRGGPAAGPVHGLGEDAHELFEAHVAVAWGWGKGLVWSDFVEEDSG